MSVPAKSHNVCTGCRSRKKKCDGQRPTCSPCTKRGALCFYDGSALSATGLGSLGWYSFDGFQTSVDQSFDVWANGTVPPSLDASVGGMNLDYVAEPMLVAAGEPSMIRGDDMFTQVTLPGILQQHSSDPSATESPGSDKSSPSLPPDRLLELVDVYFDKFYGFLPLLHREIINKAVRNPDDRGRPGVLISALVAITAGSHPHSTIRESKNVWYQLVKSQMTKAMQCPEHALQTVQAAVLIIYDALARSDFSTAWIVLGEAWRKAVAIGLNNIDGPTRLVMPALGEKIILDWLYKEQARRVVWTLFILDRLLCYPLGLVHVIDDRRLRVNFPMPDEDYQCSTEPAEYRPISFSRNFDNLLTDVQTHYHAVTSLHCIIVVCTFLGRVSDEIFSDDFDYHQSSSTLETLAGELVRLRLVLPRSFTELSAAQSSDFNHVVWINTIMGVSTVLLNHRPAADLKSVQQGDANGDNIAANASWQHCVMAARKVISTYREASLSTTDFVTNANLPSLFFTCCRILVIEYMCSSTDSQVDTTTTFADGDDSLASSTPSKKRKRRDPALRNDIALAAMVLNRMREALPGIGLKFYSGLVFILQHGEELSQTFKTSGARDLLRTCDRWPKCANEELIIPT